jgi:glucokinase
MPKIAIGVDIGGSHVSSMAFSLEKKKLLSHTFSESELDNHASSQEIIAAWAGVIKETIQLAGAEKVGGIGFAMPGPFDYVKGISLFTGQNDKYENTYGLNVPDELRKYMNLPAGFKIRFINDATAFAIGEDQVGQARRFTRSLSVTLGTGFGSAFIRNGLPVVEGQDVPKQGCLWHIPFEDGIADDYFSTRGLISRFEKETGKKTDGVKELALLAKNDHAARNLFVDFGTKMGAFVKPWIEKFGIEALVMGGNISRAYHLYGSHLEQFLADSNQPVKVAVSELKENASFIGSATLVNDRFYEQVLPVLKKM